jgi:hypothetical protein
MISLPATNPDGRADRVGAKTPAMPPGTALRSVRTIFTLRLKARGARRAPDSATSPCESATRQGNP